MRKYSKKSKDIIIKQMKSLNRLATGEYVKSKARRLKQEASEHQCEEYIKRHKQGKKLF